MKSKFKVLVTVGDNRYECGSLLVSRQGKTATAGKQKPLHICMSAAFYRVDVILLLFLSF